MDALTVLTAAEMVVEPIAVATPDPKLVLLRDMTAGADEFHVADWVRSSVLPSLYEPVAVNCRDLPSAIAETAGVIVTITSTGAVAVTARAADPETDPEVAVMVVEPTLRAVAVP